MAVVKWMQRAVFAVVAGLLAWGIFRPEMPPDPFPHSDKVGHLLGFFALALSARRAFVRAPAGWLWGVLLVAAPALEWLQHAVSPHRERSLGDALANVLGVALAWALWRLWRYWRPAPPSSP